MTIQTLDEVEQRFLNLRKEFTELQWRDSEILRAKVNALAKTDIAVAYRLMQRVKNLAPGEESRQQLTILGRQLAKEHPELLSVNSLEGGRKKRALTSMFSLFEKLKTSTNDSDKKVVLKPLYIFVLLPFFVFSFYQMIWASDRYESRTQLILKQPDGMATLDPAMALLSGFGATTGSNDNELLKSFILSGDMIMYLEQTIKLSEHYKDPRNDFFSRLGQSATQEDLHTYFAEHVKIEVEEKSSVITLLIQGFDPDFAHLLAQTIVTRAEWYINEIGHALAKEQLGFVQKEHDSIEKRLQKAKSILLGFQRKHDLLDPEAEGMALQQITYSLEAEIAKKQAQLRALTSGMSDKAPPVMQLRVELDSLNEELDSQRNRLTNSAGTLDKYGVKDDSVGEILAKFSDLKIDLELALKSYTSSLISLEKSRIEAYRQLKYLVIVESPTLPEEATYPKAFYNISLFLIVTMMLFLIGRIVIATVNELR
jgi:capsular polysaccharide transport system permease protein